MDETEILLLGPVEARRGAAAVRLGGEKQRAALALLALEAGRVVSAERLVEALWGASPPPTAATALQGHVSRLRRLLGPDAIATRAPGYVLELAPEQTDAGRFEALVAAAAGAEPGAREEMLRGALDLWRGPALEDLGAGRLIGDEARRLDELRLHAREELFDAGLQRGRHVELVPELEAFVRAEPLRERGLELFMLALYRSGRQADALDAYRRARQELRESLGLDPGPPLRELERRILEQDPGLAPPAGPERTPARRSPVTIVVLGLASDAAAADTEAYGAALGRARETARLALEGHGGVVQRAGSALIASFGIDGAREDDAARGLAAARDAVDEVAALAGELSRTFDVAVHASAGVASGEAFAGETPAIEQATILERSAGAGEIAADALTEARARGRLLAVGRPLAGRELELRRLREAYDGVLLERRSRTLAIVGPAGIGKSRLAGELLASVAGDARVIATRCLSYGDGVGGLPATEIVRGVAEISPESSEAEARTAIEEIVAGGAESAAATEQLLRLLGLSDAPSDDEEAAWAMRRLLEGAARKRPLVVYVDDLQWASPTVSHLVALLADPCDAQLMVVTTARPAPAVPAAEQSIALAPLEPADCATLVSSIVGGEIDAAALATLVDASGGNPLFLEELALDLRERGRLREHEGIWRLEGGETPLPSSIESLIAARLERLPEREREVLAAASVIGRSFTLAELAALAGDELDAPLAALVAELLLQAARPVDEDLQFRHLLIRDAAYASLPLERRAELHRRLADSIVQIRVAAPLEREALAVYHLDQAHRARASLAPGDPQLAADAPALARRTATLGYELVGRGDAAAAASLLARALELDDSDPRVAVELGRARLDVGDFAAAEAAFALVDTARATLGRLDVRVRTDPAFDFDSAAAEIDAALAEVERGGDELAVAEAWVLRANIALFRGRAGDLGETIDRALERLPAQLRSRAHTWLLFLACAVCWYGPMRVEDGIRRCEEVLDRAHGERAVQAAALQCLGVLHAMQGAFERGRALVHESRAITRELGQYVASAGSAIDSGIVELLAGEHASAEALLREGYAELEQLGEKAYFSTLACLLAEAVEAQGRIDEAREIARAAAEAASADDVVSQVGWRATESRALAAAGAREEAERLAREGAALADETDFLLLRAEAWAAVADVSGEAAARAHAVELLERKGCAQAAIAAWARVTS